MKNATEIVMVLDKSGSMEALKSDAIGGFNQFLREQQAEPGEANLTIVLFDTADTVHPARPIAKVEPLNDRSYSPSGGTALLDALGRAIRDTGARLSALPEAARPDKVIVVTITDGEENSSTSFKLSDVRDMIAHQRERYAWQFLFLGANQDAFAEAGNLGVSAAMAMGYAADAEGIMRAYSSSSKAVRDYRKRGWIDSMWEEGHQLRMGRPG
jgi:uncharacterized protein YegL